jgi:hypothetical protein
MKKVSRTQRTWLGRKQHKRWHREAKHRHRAFAKAARRKTINLWVRPFIEKGVDISIDSKNRGTLTLPSEMDFYKNYECTALYMQAIRKFTKHRSESVSASRLVSVNFSSLNRISTSAALVLTAELSNWDDQVGHKLQPKVDSWDPKIYKQFDELGFFDLFENATDLPKSLSGELSQSELNLVRYKKGKCGEEAAPRALKDGVQAIVGKDVKKWTFLASGLNEAITNVSHHAYPKRMAVNPDQKHWYLTAAYNKNTRELKVVFFDQGVGIPNSLPASGYWEKIQSMLAALPLLEGRTDASAIKAAVEVDRTSTNRAGRGKGLQDLLVFLRMRQAGYLSILSYTGLYKLSVSGGKESIKSVSFKEPVLGTLIIWSAVLDQ